MSLEKKDFSAENIKERLSQVKGGYSYYKEAQNILSDMELHFQEKYPDISNNYDGDIKESSPKNLMEQKALELMIRAREEYEDFHHSPLAIWNVISYRIFQ